MPTLTMPDDQFNSLKQEMTAARPIKDRIASGDTTLTASELSIVSKVYDTWADMIDRA
jgi:hypothetical protein